MAEITPLNNILLLFDSYSKDSKKLHESFQKAQYHCKTVVIEDNGFLPDGVETIYDFFLGDFSSCVNENVIGKPRYFNQIQVPDGWEITGNNSNGKVMNMGKERGRIFYTEPLNKRLVRIVDWLDESGYVRSSDHYNKYGALYCRTIFNAKGQKVNRSFFSPDGKEIIVENFVTKDVILNDREGIHIFKSMVDFIMYYLLESNVEQTRIFYNTLSTSFFVSQRSKPDVEKNDILFWQEPERPDIPGNMQIILNGQSGRTQRIYVQNKRAYEKLVELGVDTDVVKKLGFIYPFEKENHYKPEALICTNSDNIEQCERIVQDLFQIHFHILALTEMSPKLMNMEKYLNVTLYPGVKAAILEELFDHCDYYFDINHESEIVDAVYKAFLHNHLIYAFEETIHNKEYIARNNIYSAANVEVMIRDIKKTIENSELVDTLIKAQHENAMVEGVESYKVFA